MKSIWQQGQPTYFPDFPVWLYEKIHYPLKNILFIILILPFLIEYIKFTINQTISKILEKALMLDQHYIHSENVALNSGEL